MRRLTVKVLTDVPPPHGTAAHEIRWALEKLAADEGIRQIGARGEHVSVSLAWKTAGLISMSRGIHGVRRVVRAAVRSGLLSPSVEPAEIHSTMETTKPNEIPSLIFSLAWRIR